MSVQDASYVKKIFISSAVKLIFKPSKNNNKKPILDESLTAKQGLSTAKLYQISPSLLTESFF